MAKPNLLLNSATELESGTIQSELGDAKTTQHAGKTVIVGDLCGWQCTLIHTGIGAVNAAHALTCQLERQTPALVIQFGIGGAYVPTGLPIRSIALATEEVYGDVGVVTPEGWKPADEIVSLWCSVTHLTSTGSHWTHNWFQLLLRFAVQGVACL